MNRKDQFIYFLYISIMVIFPFALSFYFLITSESIKDLFNIILEDNKLPFAALLWLNVMIGLVRVLFDMQKKINKKDKGASA
ncbi:MAG: hypothetical protein KDI50_03045 [Candidatus Competibacteraceae bacterium]|nr:hypothetical protein [Candidatus Competibacteraceae bacterium]